MTITLKATMSGHNGHKPVHEEITFPNVQVHDMFVTAYRALTGKELSRRRGDWTGGQLSSGNYKFTTFNRDGSREIDVEISMAKSEPAVVEPVKPAMREYTFDLHLKAAVTVKAAFARDALRMIEEAFQCADCNGGAWGDGSPILFEASLVERPDIGMIDGADVHITTLRDYQTLFYSEES